MALGSIILALILAGFALWLIRFLPIDPTIRQIITGVVILILVLVILQAFGIIHTGIRF